MNSAFTGDEKKTLEAASCVGLGRQWTPATVSVSHPGTSVHVKRSWKVLAQKLDMMTRLDQPHLPQCMCEDRQAGFPHLHGSQLGWREIGYQMCFFQLVYI